MWFVFHHGAKTKVVAGGRSFVETCPECHRRARFDEVEVTESVGVFFVDLLDNKERKFRCSACSDVFDLRDQAPAAAAKSGPTAAPAKSARELERERAAAAAVRFAEDVRRREAAEAKANRIEDELAELKKRMGR